MKIRLLIKAAIAFLPSILKCTIYRHIFGYKIGRRVKIGLSILDVGKCGLRALQYMAPGMPAICSPFGVNSIIITGGKNRFLANNPADWIAKLKLRIHSPELRAGPGEAGRRTVENEYSAKVIAPKVW